MLMSSNRDFQLFSLLIQVKANEKPIESCFFKYTQVERYATCFHDNDKIITEKACTYKSYYAI